MKAGDASAQQSRTLLLPGDHDVHATIIFVSQEYSKRLRIIEPSQFQAALDRFDLGTFVAAMPIRFGLLRQNVFVSSTGGEWVCRTATIHRLYDSLIIWSYFQRVQGGLPENKTLSLEEWASLFIDYWKTFKT